MPHPPPCSSPAACPLLKEALAHGLDDIMQDCRHLVVRNPGHECPRSCHPTLPAEMVHAIPQRRGEFIVGRLAAYQLLHSINAPAAQCWVGSEGRRPLWPLGYTGSISHTQDLVAVAVTHTGALCRSIGIDIERLRQPAEALDALEPCFNRQEHRILSGLDNGLVIGFSAKEALYKSLNPLVRRFIDFDAVAIVEFCNKQQQLYIQLTPELRFSTKLPSVMMVKFAFMEGHVWTGAEVEIAST